MRLRKTCAAKIRWVNQMLEASSKVHAPASGHSHFLKRKTTQSVGRRGQGADARADQDEKLDARRVHRAPGAKSGLTPSARPGCHLTS